LPSIIQSIADDAFTESSVDDCIDEKDVSEIIDTIVTRSKIRGVNFDVPSSLLLSFQLMSDEQKKISKERFVKVLMEVVSIDSPQQPRTPQRTLAFNLLRDRSIPNLSQFNIENMSQLDQEKLSQDIENLMLQQLRKNKIFQLSDILPYIAGGVGLVVQDDFTKCFQENIPEPWNWNIYLFSLWCGGVVVRYGVLLPLRTVSLLIGFAICAFGMVLVKLVFRKNKRKRQAWERRLVRFLASSFVFSWTGVIKYHGVIPKRQPNQIFVANHTSMIDVIILQQMNAFAAVGQKHAGWVGFLQDEVLGCLGCIWFNRSESKDRLATAKRIREHIANDDSNRLLVFPEGTCVNNEYCVQFKKGVFELDATICPIAIKYNKTFVDAFWNSRKRPFQWHLFDLMSSWAVICDVWYLEPQTREESETPIEFAARVKSLICEKAKLTSVEWDGYMKYFAPSARFVRESQKLFAESLKRPNQKKK